MKEKLRLLNPKNLEREVHKYGYEWSLRSHIVLTLAVLTAMGAIGFVFRLEAGYLAVAMAAVFLLLPVLVLDVFQKMFEQKRFSDIATYMEQMLYSFQKSGKVLLALKECRTLFEKGQMRDCIQEAVYYLERGKAKGEDGILKEALELIEKAYPCTKVYLVHELLIGAETYGGECETSILLLLKDIELWKRRGYKLQQEKKNSHKDNLISIVIATLLCAVALYILDSMKNLFGTARMPFDIFRVTIVQCSSLLFILFCIYVFAKSTKSLSRNWLKEPDGRKTEDVLDSYWFVVNYEEKKERRKSIWMGGVPLFAAVVLIFCRKYAIALVLTGVAGFLLIQHRVGYTLAKKDVTEELYMAFPQWLMQMALLLQSNNVQVSLQKSIMQAPAILKPELEKLMEQINEAPDRLTSYTGFCSLFDIPEASSCMKMFHAISEAGSGNVKEQMKELLKRVGEMQGMADELRNKSIAFQMKMIFSYPVVAATIKLLCDFSIGMLYMFRMLGNMGGGIS